MHKALYNYTMDSHYNRPQPGVNSNIYIYMYVFYMLYILHKLIPKNKSNL